MPTRNRRKPRSRSNQDAGPQRLQKVLAHAGVASRRKAEEMIAAGRVSVNGKVVREMGIKVDARRDKIAVDGKPIGGQSTLRYYLLYKPRGVVSTVRDPGGHQTVLDLVPSNERLYPVGRLDQESEGLILMTNDGALTERLTHPRYEHAKEYRVMIRGQLARHHMHQLEQGVAVEGEETAMQAKTRRMAPQWGWRDEETPGDASWLSITLKEGRKRQIRRMLDALGYRTLRLIRVRMGGLHLGKLEPGQGRWLGRNESNKLRTSCGLAPRKE